MMSKADIRAVAEECPNLVIKATAKMFLLNDAEAVKEIMPATDAINALLQLEPKMLKTVTTLLEALVEHV